MYYYIFDQPQGSNEYQRTAEIKERLNTLGIAGEMATPTPGKGVQELVQIAVQKRYATIVAVGGITLINQVARAIEPYDVVLGIIPLQENPAIFELIGSDSWQAAADQLKKRRWRHIKLGLMQGDICFLTPATLSTGKDKVMQLKTPDFQLSDADLEITITPLRTEQEQADGALILEMHKQTAKKAGFLEKLRGPVKTAQETSRFYLDSFTLETQEPAQVSVAGEVLTTTPLTCTTQSKPLRLIVARGGAESA